MGKLISKPTWVVPLFLFAGLASCDTDISSASRLRRVRLLAVQAEPPNPVFGQSTRLRPLVYVPAGESVTYEWSWCPVPTSSEDGYQCPVDQTAVDNIATQTGLHRHTNRSYWDSAAVPGNHGDHRIHQSIPGCTTGKPLLG